MFSPVAGFSTSMVRAASPVSGLLMVVVSATSFLSSLWRT
jgi:hypothetical protein